MKRYILICFVIATTSLCNAQKLDFGVKGGLNFARVSKAEIVNGTVKEKLKPKSRTGYHAGIYARLGIPFIAIQPELLYSQKGYTYTKDNVEVDAVYHYIDVPIVGMFKIFPGVTLNAGPQYSFLLNQKTDVNSNTTSSLKNFNASEVSGLVGINFQLFMVGASFRYTFGLNDITKNDAVNSKNQVIQLSLSLKIK